MRQPVSIHAPAWGATADEQLSDEPRIVSIHAPAWGATGIDETRQTVVRSFNPRARVGRDGRGGRTAIYFVDVSIHAPAWGATRLTLRGVFLMLVSIHAPAWGATERRAIRGRIHWGSIHAPAWGATGISFADVATVSSFNPRARVGRDELSGMP